MPEVAAAIARARDLGEDAIGEGCLAIADSAPATSEGVQKAKLRVWTRLQLLAKWNPKKYGDKVEQTVRGDETAPPVRVTVTYGKGET